MYLTVKKLVFLDSKTFREKCRGGWGPLFVFGSVKSYLDPIENMYETTSSEL